MFPPAGEATRARQSAGAFTLLELLVAIAIITVLIAILMPALSRARAAARGVVCLANARQLSTAAQMYANDHGVYIGWSSDADRKQLLFPYLGSGRSNADLDGDQVWHCPSNERPDREAAYGFNVYLNWEKLVHVAAPSCTVAITDAGINDDLEPILATRLSASGRNATHPRLVASGKRFVALWTEQGEGEPLRLRIATTHAGHGSAQPASRPARNLTGASAGHRSADGMPARADPACEACAE